MACIYLHQPPRRPLENANIIHLKSGITSNNSILRQPQMKRKEPESSIEQQTTVQKEGIFAGILSDVGWLFDKDEDGSV